MQPIDLLIKYFYLWGLLVCLTPVIAWLIIKGSGRSGDD
jgi:hypothetical protein